MYKVHTTLCKRKITKYTVQSTVYTVQTTHNTVQSALHKVQSTKLKYNKYKVHVQSTKYKVPNTKYKIQYAVHITLFTEQIYTVQSTRNVNISTLKCLQAVAFAKR